MPTIEIASLEHRHILASFFVNSHVDYVPESIRWPTLSESRRAQLAAMPFWQEAVSTENKASNTVTAAASLEADPEIRKAIEMQGFEEHRHARLLVALTAHYRINVELPPRFVPKSLENDFLSAGFGECFDSFFAFGLFAQAQKSGYFAPELIEIFEPVVQEEARHILFFVNWVRIHRAELSWAKRLSFRLRCTRIILAHVLSRVRTARTLAGGGEDEENFTISAHRQVGEPITLRSLLEICLRENSRRMDAYDPRLLRPQLVPALARLGCRLLPSGQKAALAKPA